MPGSDQIQKEIKVVEYGNDPHLRIQDLERTISELQKMQKIESANFKELSDLMTEKDERVYYLEEQVNSLRDRTEEYKQLIDNKQILIERLTTQNRLVKDENSNLKMVIDDLTKSKDTSAIFEKMSEYLDSRRQSVNVVDNSVITESKADQTIDNSYVNLDGASEYLQVPHDHDVKSRVSGVMRLKKDIRDIRDQFRALGLGSVIANTPSFRIENTSMQFKDQDEELLFESNQE